MIRRNLIFFLWIVCASITAQTTKKTLITISGKITQTSSYCGGAAPSPEMLEEYETPKPYIGKTLYVRKGNRNNLKEKIILSFKADAKGNFSFQLEPGIYSIIVEEQVKTLTIKQTNPGVQADTACLKKWWVKPYHLLNVKENNITGLNFNFHHPCFITSDIPCFQYNGPMPP